MGETTTKSDSSETTRWHDLRESTLDSLTTSAILVVEHFPLFTGVVLTLAIGLLKHLWRDQQAGEWTQTLDWALWIAKFTMFMGLVTKPAQELLGELAEGLALWQYRVRHAWRTGERLPHETEQESAR